MPIPDLPTPEDLWTQLLVRFFGASAAIVAVYGLFMALLAWRSAWFTSIKIGRYTASATGRALKLRPVAFGFALLTSAVMLAVQAIWMWTCFVAGNAWSYLIHPPGQIPDGGPEWDRIFGSLHWDTVSKVYVGACILVLLSSYVAAGRGKDSTGIGVFLVAPTGLVAVLALFPAVLGLLLAVGKRFTDGEFVLDPFVHGVLVLLGLALAHIISSLSALGTPGMMSKAWTRP
jgi:hypothetical protein